MAAQTKNFTFYKDHIYPLVVYDVNPVNNNRAKLLARVIDIELLPLTMFTLKKYDL